MTATICAQLSQHTLSLAGLLQQVERVCAVEPQVGALVQGVGITYRVLASRTGCWHHVQGVGMRLELARPLGEHHCCAAHQLGSACQECDTSAHGCAKIERSDTH